MGNSSNKQCLKCNKEYPATSPSCTYCRNCKLCNTNINDRSVLSTCCEKCEVIIKLGEAQIASTVPTTVPTTVSTSTVPIRTCESCKVDISDTPSYHKVCKQCYKLQLIEKTCCNCNRPFKVTKQESYKQLCPRSDCVKIDSETEQRVKEKLAKDGYSSKAITWLQSIAEKEKIVIQHKLNGGEYKLKTKVGWKTVDGYHADSNTVYEFYGTYYHGDPDISTHTKLGVGGKTYKELYEQTLRREQAIRDAGYKVIVIFEGEYDKL